MSTYYVPRTVVGTRDRKVNKAVSFCPLKLAAGWEQCWGSKALVG